MYLKSTHVSNKTQNQLQSDRQVLLIGQNFAQLNSISNSVNTRLTEHCRSATRLTELPRSTLGSKSRSSFFSQIEFGQQFGHLSVNRTATSTDQTQFGHLSNNFIFLLQTSAETSITSLISVRLTEQCPGAQKIQNPDFLRLNSLSSYMISSILNHKICIYLPCLEIS